MPSPSLESSVQTPEILRNVEQVLPIPDIFPTPAILLGGAVLIGVVLFHGLAMRWVQGHVAAADARLRRDPSVWRTDLAMAVVVGVLLGAALLEVAAWSAVLKHAGLLPSWAAAASYAASSYTTLGDSPVAPGPAWTMIGPIIAISGLFTFGWSGSVLVNVVGRIARVRERVRGRSATPR